MPLTESGKKVKREMEKEYGPEKGEQVFYAKENADKKFKKLVTGKSDAWWGERIARMPKEMRVKLIDIFKSENVRWWVDRIIAMKAQHEGHLVTADGEKHLPTKTNGKPNHRLMGAAAAALTSPSGYRGNKYQGPDKESAIKKLKHMYEQEGMEFPKH